MEKYEPYNFDSFKELLGYAYNLGWYGGRKTLFNLKCEGEFEGFYGRANENWNQQFTLTSEEIFIDGSGVDSPQHIIPALNITGKTVEEVCSKALKLLRPSNTPENN